jgi:hypothetical protein
VIVSRRSRIRAIASGFRADIEQVGRGVPARFRAMHRLACVFMLFSIACDGGETTTPEDVAQTQSATQPNVAPSVQDTAPSRPALDEETASEIAGVLAAMPPERRPLLAAQALVELETGRIPTAAAQLLDTLPTLPPEHRTNAIAIALTRDLLGELDVLCSGKASATMQQVTTIDLEDHGTHYWATCDLGRVQLMSEEDAAQLHAMPMLLAHLIAWHLRDGGGLHDAEATLLRELARG